MFYGSDDPIELFDKWYDEAKKSEINDPNAIALATSNINTFHQLEWY